jgi:hypothetical protein
MGLHNNFVALFSLCFKSVFLYLYFYFLVQFFLFVASKDGVLEVNDEKYVFMSHEQNAGEYHNLEIVISH